MHHPYFDPNRLLPLPPGDQPSRREHVLNALAQIQRALLSVNGIGLLIAAAVFVYFTIWFAARLVDWLMTHLDGALQ